MSNATAALVTKIDAVGDLPRRARNNALLAIHAEMCALSVPANSFLWAMLNDAYEALS